MWNLRRHALSVLVIASLLLGGFSPGLGARQAGTADPLRAIADYTLRFGGTGIMPDAFCTLLGIEQGEERRRYKQIEMSSPTQFKAIQVNRDPVGGRIDIVLGDKTENEGYLFRVTVKGDLLKAVYLQKGKGGVVVSDPGLQEKVRQEIAFWLEQEPRLRASRR